MADQNLDLEFVDYVVKALVDNPDKVAINREIDEMGVLLTLTVDPSDMGQIIGRQGQTAKAIRTLLKVVGAKNNARVNLKINEPEGSKRSPRGDEAKPEGSAPAAPAPAAPAAEADTSMVDDLNL
ncbi:KH domain-containing protein [Patescibacteria group bacterium]|nr:KH domain-containing protein [Patescibacteria group bacterium]